MWTPHGARQKKDGQMQRLSIAHLGELCAHPGAIAAFLVPLFPSLQLAWRHDLEAQPEPGTRGGGLASTLNGQHWQCITEQWQWGKTSLQLGDSLSYSRKSACKHLKVTFNHSLPSLFIHTPQQFISKPDKWRNWGCSHANSWATRHLLLQEWV